MFFSIQIFDYGHEKQMLVCVDYYIDNLQYFMEYVDNRQKIFFYTLFPYVWKWADYALFLTDVIFETVPSLLILGSLVEGL